MQYFVELKKYNLFAILPSLPPPRCTFLSTLWCVPPPAPVSPHLRRHSGESKPRPAVVFPCQVPVTQGVLNLSSAAENTGTELRAAAALGAQSVGEQSTHPSRPATLYPAGPTAGHSSELVANVARRGVERRGTARRTAAVRFRSLALN